MGVMTCQRNGCDNIMCDRYSHEFGYICDECFSEMIDYILVNGKFFNLNEDIQEFIEIPKSSRNLTTSLRGDIWKLLDEEFKTERDRNDYE